MQIQMQYVFRLRSMEYLLWVMVRMPLCSRDSTISEIYLSSYKMQLRHN